jgi:hypothetical protein
MTAPEAVDAPATACQVSWADSVSAPHVGLVCLNHNHLDASDPPSHAGLLRKKRTKNTHLPRWTGRNSHHLTTDAGVNGRGLDNPDNFAP